MSRAARIGILCASIAIFCYAGIGHVLGRTTDDKAYKSLTVYGEVLQKIQQDYVDDPNMRTVTAGSLHGMLESLDAQSSYLTPREYDEYKKKLANTGTGETGLTLSKRYGYVIVLSVLPDSPGTQAGIRKVILDVRECGRGPVSEAISTARLFVPSGMLTTLRGQTVSTQVFSAEPKQVVWKNPVAVLIDATTSGAAEVLASAIAANHR